MKYLIYLIIIFIINVNHSEAQWDELHFYKDIQLESVSFHNENIGFVVGISNNIYRTLDGGVNWEIVFTSPELVIYEDVFVINSNEIIVVGRKLFDKESRILKSLDGGDTWDFIEISSNGFLRSVFFVDDSIGYLVSSKGEIFKSINGGLEWELILDLTDDLRSVYFVNPLVGIVVGGDPGQPIILQTMDGGIVWLPVIVPADNYLVSSYMFDTGIGYSVGTEGEVLKTENFGFSWEKINSLNLYGHKDVYFTDENVGFVAGGTSFSSVIMKTTNGGSDWEDVNSDDKEPLTSLTFVGENIGYAVGFSGRIVKTINAGGLSMATNHSDLLFNFLTFPNPVINELNVELNVNNQFEVVKVYDIKGELILECIDKGSRIKVDFSKLKSGIYFLLVETKDGLGVKKVIKY